MKIYTFLQTVRYPVAYLSMAYFSMACISMVGALATAQVASADTIEEIIVSADFRKGRIMDMPASLTVISEEEIRNRTAQHMEDMLNVAPNVNFASGASRGRYIQIRGIGERSQFVDPINPSVGVTIDDMDFSGIGGAATLFDVRQMEVLRGPQGTRFGANALAGMVNITSADPTEVFEGRVESSLGTYDTWSLGAVVSGPLRDDLSGRLAVQQYRSDGFMENIHLGRDDTGNRDEMTVRGKLRWQASEDWAIDFTGFYADIDNGYDAFSLDNTRQTLSDEPGQDKQQTVATKVKATWTGSEAFVLEAIASYSNSDLEYGYDEDWTYVGIHPSGYSSTDNYLRDRESRRLELRFLSQPGAELFGNTAWVAGIYLNHRDVDLERQFFDWILYTPDATFLSQYETRNLALYGQLDTQLTDRLVFTAGVRREEFDGDYQDNQGITATPGEGVWGGELSLKYRASDNALLYVLISRGYKVGGVNGDALGKAQKSGFQEEQLEFLQNRLEFSTENLNNWEFGLKGVWFDSRLTARVAAFYMDRDNVQLKGWINEDQSFIGYVDNAARGANYGAEIELAFNATDALQLFANLGGLITDIQDFEVYDSVQGELVDKSGRDQAHAPNYQFNIGGEWQTGNGLYARIELEGKDNFYFSDSHDQKSDSYQLLHARFGYRNGPLNLALWGRNLTNKDYQVRGFYFPNDPRKAYIPEPYYQYGEPRLVGISASYEF